MSIETKEEIEILLFSIISNEYECDDLMLTKEIIPFINFEPSNEYINYNKVLQQLLTIYGIPLCGKSCRFKATIGYVHLPLLIRQKEKKCIKCNNYISNYSHKVCYRHANFEEYYREFIFHHTFCY